MADIRLAKPAAGASESVQCAPDARFVFDFPTTDATLAREGDNLNISFQDGSQLQLQGFYQEYNGENLPSFNIDGTEVAAADFFAAMNEPDLMPAAGPGTGTAANGARFHEWGDSSLASGIDHLNGLDWGFSRSFEWEDHPNAVGYHHDDDGESSYVAAVDHPVTITPFTPGDADDSGLGLPNDVVMVKEAKNGVTKVGGMRVDAPDGVGEIEIDGQLVWAHGAPVAGATIELGTEGCTLSNFNYNSHTGELTYSFTVPTAQTHSKEDGNDEALKWDLSMTVRDVDGDAAEGTITLVVRDDVPEFYRDVEGQKEYYKDGDTIDVGQGTVSLDSKPELSVNFTEDGWADRFAEQWGLNKPSTTQWRPSVDTKEIGAGASHLVHSGVGEGEVNFNMTASFVHYKFENTNGVLNVENVIDITNAIYNSEKNFTVINGEAGLTVGAGNIESAWNQSPEISTATGVANLHANWVDNPNAQKLTDAYGIKSDDKLSGTNISEAVVFDLYDVAYGMDLDLSNISAGDRVLVTYLMTPPYSTNDENIVRKEYVSRDDLKDGRYHSDVPEGFTKVFVSSLGSAKYDIDADGLGATLQDGQVEKNNGFTIKGVAFLTKQWHAEGQVQAESADGITSYAWNWDAFGEFRKPENADDTTEAVWQPTNKVHVKGALAGDYSVTMVENDEGVWTAYLTDGMSGNDKLNEAILFTATIGEDGIWTFTQNYEFSMDVDTPFKITATDGDLDTTDIALNINPQFLPFAEEKFGFYKQEWFENRADKDIANDVLEGNDDNSLIYGKGGDDLLVGDSFQEQTITGEDSVSQAFNAIQDAVAGEDRKFDNHTEGQYGKDDTMPVGGHKIETVQEKLAELTKPEDFESLGNRLEESESTESHAESIYVANDVLYGGNGDDILLGMGGDDRLYGEKGNDLLFGGSGNDYLDGGSGEDTLVGGGGEDVLVGGTGGTDQVLQGVNANIAFLVDVSNGNDFSAAQKQLANLFNQMQEEYRDNPGDVNILLMGFHSYATQTVSVNIRNAGAWEDLMKGLEDIAGKSKITPALDDREELVYNHAAESSNHELAFNYAHAWFAQQDNDGFNKTYLLSSQPASSHIFAGDKPYDDLFYVLSNGGLWKIDISTLDGIKQYDEDTGVMKIKYDKETGRVEIKDYVLGEEYPLTINGVPYAVVNKDGLLEFVKDGNSWKKGELLPGKEDLEGSGFGTGANNKAPTPLMLRYDAENQTWILAAVGGAVTAEGAPDLSAATGTSYTGLSAESTVTLVGSDATSVGADYTGIGHVNEVEDVLATLPVPTHPGDTLLGGEGNDVLFGDDLPADFAGMSAAEIQKVVRESPDDFANAADGGRAENDHLDGGAGDDILFGGAGDDTLLGGGNEDILFGGSGNDFLDGGDGRDTIFGGSGDDLIVYDPTDYLIEGGEGIDFLLSSLNKPEYTLDEMVKNYTDNDSQNMPRVNGVEVMLKGVDTSLQNMEQLAEKYGFEVKHENGKDILVLGENWQKATGDGATGNGGTTVYEYTGDNGIGVTLETSLGEDQAAQQYIVANSNG